MGWSWKQGVTTNQTFLLLARMLARQAAQDWLSEQCGCDTDRPPSDRQSSGESPGEAAVVHPPSWINEHDA